MQGLKGIASAMTQGQYDLVGNDTFTVLQLYAANLLVLNIKTRYFLGETNFTTQRNNLLAHFFNYAH